MLLSISALARRAPAAIAIAAAISAIATTAIAQYHPARADAKGDYYTLDVGDRGYQSLWVVVAGNLNCRMGAGSQYKVLVTWQKKARLTVQTPDESREIQKDANGKPWLRVAWDRSSCFVRANRKYINPVY